MEDWRGQLVDGYRVRGRLGEGTIGITYRAFHPVEHLDAVLKVLSPHLNAQQEVLTEFGRLVNGAAALNHPGIARVIGHGVWRDQNYLVTEYIAGPSLRQVLDRIREPLAWTDILQIGDQVSSALVYAHSQNALHLGVRPENILLGRQKPAADSPSDGGYQAVLTDLGLRRLLEISFQPTSSSNPPDVLAYLSPEQCVASPAGAKTDVYSLGIVLYEMIAGQLPFRTPTVEEAVVMHMRTIPKRVSQHRIDVPTQIEELVMAMLAKQPRERPEMGEVRDRLREAHGRLDLRAGSSWEKLAGPAMAAERRPTVREPEVVPDGPPAGARSRARPTAAGPAELHVSRRGENMQVVALEHKRRLVLGRDTGCDIVLNDRRVSRRHCEVRWEGDHATVTDLGSNNGTYLGDVKLIPHQPEHFRAGTGIRVPPYTIRLEMVAPSPQPVAAAPAAAAPAPLGPVGKFASVTLDREQVRATPGGAPESVVVTIQNMSRVVDWYRLGVTGVPRDWISGIDQNVQLNPRQQGSVTLTIHPPAEPTTTAGTHTAQIFVRSREQNVVVAKTELSLEVGPFSRFEADLSPTQVETRTRAALQVTITNRGNTPSTYMVAGRDDAQALMFEVVPDQIELAPAASQAAQVSAAPRKPNWIGSKQLYPFSVTVASSTAEPRTLIGQFGQRAWLPSWVPLILLLLCCGAAGLLAATGPNLYAVAFPSPTLTATPPFTPTSTATWTPTPTLTTTPTPNLTATWEVMDSDGDGLTNAEELRYGTDPYRADTDGDGLTDYEEIKIYFTNPLNVDTDGDGWMDGEEVRMALTLYPGLPILCPNPNNPDSDGDGVIDRLDPNPCDLPTVTPSVTPTTTPVPSFGVGAQISTNDNLSVARGAGLTWIKKQVRFGPGDSAAALGADVNAWHSAGFKVLLSVVGHREDLAQGAGYYDQYAQFVGGLAALGVEAIEVWNEMNIDHEWPTGQISPRAYVDLLVKASAAIRAQGAGTMVISGGPAPTGFDDNTTAWSDKRYLEGMAAAGAARYIDCIGIHYNEGIIAPSETSGDPRQEGGHYTRYFWGMVDTYWGTFGGAVPLCFTELGYLSPEGYGQLPANFRWAQDTSVFDQATWLAEAVQLAHASGKVRLLIIWNLDFTVYSDRDPQAGYAIIRKDGSCPACQRLSAVIPR
jgi:hypothetical protein